MIHKNRLLILAFLSLWLVPCPVISQERIQDESARSDFIYRVNLGRADDVRLLIRQGASANQLSGTGVPVLCLAAARNDDEGINVVHALLENDANISARDRKGQTALFYAAKNGNLDIMAYLLDNGIDMYAIDNSGNVARSAAHIAGHPDSVKALDDYVQSQTAQITKKYLERNKSILKRNQTILARRNQAASDKKREETKKTTSQDDAGDDAEIAVLDDADIDDNEDDNAYSASAAGVVRSEKNNEKEILDEAYNSLENQSILSTNPEDSLSKQERQELLEMKKDALNGRIHDMAYNVCVFQYWYYCSSAKQSTDIDREELIVAIESTRNAAENIREELVKEYHMSPAKVGTIAKIAQKRIYQELNSMASNRDRHEKGVGRLDDLRRRCGFIARQWGAIMPEPVKRRHSGKKSSAGDGSERKVRTGKRRRSKRNLYRY